MKRRGFISGIGAATVGAGGLFGTGAFTSVNADRTAQVEVAEEDSAYLAIFPSNGQPNGSFATDGGTSQNAVEIGFDFNDASGTASGSQGPGVDSTYIFDDVFRVANQGTQEVYVDLMSLNSVPLLDVGGDGDQGDVTLEFFAKDSSGNREVIDGSNAELTVPVGGQRPVGTRVITDPGSTYGDINSPNDNNTTQSTTTTITADTTVDSGNAIDPGTPNPIINP